MLLRAGDVSRYDRRTAGNSSVSSYPGNGRVIVEPIVIDVSRIAAPDAPVLDTLARLQLLALRLGASIEIRNACPLLVDLIDIAGLADVLIVGESVEVNRQVEEREQVGVDEEVLGDDGAV